MRFFTTFVILLLIAGFVPAQNKYTLSGVVSDGENGETLPGASITVAELPGSGVTTNAYGYWCIKKIRITRV